MKILTLPHTLKTVATVAAVMAGTVLISMEAHAVAGFSRQTGMSCNQCHTSHGGATPNFTFAGKKFNALGYRLQVQEPDIEKGEPEDLGEHMSLYPNEWSGRFQWTGLSNAKPPAGPNAGEWGEETSNPTSRLAIFPFVGNIGKHFGVWTEFYVVPLSSEQGEWNIANASYEEHDFRYIINPDSEDNIYGLSFNNQGIGAIFGFGPWPAVGMNSEMNRGGIGGFAHPNRSHMAAYGWMDDRWVWALGGHTGDTNNGWNDANTTGMVGYAFRNGFSEELWANLYFRSGDDALPLVTGTSVPGDEHDFFFSENVAGISETRPAACPSPDRYILQGCPYLASDLEDHSTVEAELRWSRQDAGPWSFEIVGRVGFNEEDYIDGASTTQNDWGIATQFAWKHTYYIKPYINGHLDFEFTDMSGQVHDIDSSTGYGLWLSFKPVENFLINFEYHKLQSQGLGRPSLDDGARYAISTDISF